MKQSQILLDQIIEMARAKDEMWKDACRKLHRASQSVGDDSIVFHLEQLKVLLKEEENDGDIFIGGAG